MEQIVVKNGEILLFYVDETDTNEEGVTTVQEIHQDEQEQKHEVEIIEENEILTDSNTWRLEEVEQQVTSTGPWLYDEINRLLTFFIDNKSAFVNGTAKKKDLWTVACKTMLAGRNITQCEMKLRSLKKRYAETRRDLMRGIKHKWQHYDLCHQAFHDDNFVSMFLGKPSDRRNMNVSALNKTNNSKVVVVKEVSNTRTSDEKVEMMLNLYLKYKSNEKSYWQKGLWQNIALQIGEEDGEYWHRRFLNFKQHYIRLVDKRAESGQNSVSWPYMKLFDQIFEGDEEFQRKFAPELIPEQKPVKVEFEENVWNETETTVLVKYYFECFNEFYDPTIPNKFLWAEVSRLLARSPPEICQNKFEELKTAHMTKYVENTINIRERVPMEIILDNIIAKEVDSELNKPVLIETEWSIEESDDLAQFIYENMDFFKDSVGYYVCWAVAAQKLSRSISSCRKQWRELTVLYKTILEDKKENPDMQIDWRYIEVFDRIFDYGMDTDMLEGYDKPGRITVKDFSKMKDEPNENGIDDDTFTENESDDNSENNGLRRSKRKRGDSKAFKILEYYLKNKDKFGHRKKMGLWEVLAKQLGISADQIAHRFRHLKQVYKNYVQRELNKPAKPIVWPYYALCKKAFGYRAMRTKLKNSNVESEEDDWSAKEIKQLINYLNQNFDTIINEDVDISKWTGLSQEIGRTEEACAEKFAEIQKSYRKLKNMKTEKPEVKVSWKYYNMIDNIYSSNELVETVENMDVDEKLAMQIANGEHPDEEFQYIIVLPEGQDISDIDPQILLQGQDLIIENQVDMKTTKKWNRLSKKRLLIQYLKYLRSHKGQVVNRKRMWEDISSNLNRTPISCRKMMAVLKKNHVAEKNGTKNQSPYFNLLEKISRFKPKFDQISPKKESSQPKTYKDVDLPEEKILLALNHYLEHIEEFASPRYEKKYLWTELANTVKEPVTKVFNKINYLKQNSAENNTYEDILKQILEQESALKEKVSAPSAITEETDQTWSDDEIEQLLTCYLENLDKFKNPKLVRKYLWMDVSAILDKSPLGCSRKMTEIRTQYKAMIKENTDDLKNWRFFDLCQKIYGTGKKNVASDGQEEMQS